MEPIGRIYNKEGNQINTDFSELLGKVLTKVVLDKDKRYISFFTRDNREYMMYHGQDCCESVLIDDICGDLEDLVGSVILQAEKSSNSGETSACDHYTWTFYRIATIKGQVVIKWYGSSNGYYSEDVDFALIPLPGEEYVPASPSKYIFPEGASGIPFVVTGLY